MSQNYHFTFVDAPIEIVWRIAFQQAEQNGSIINMEEPKLLVVQSQDLCSIYGLRQYPAMENKTGLYLVLTHDEAAADVVNARDLYKALEAMPVDVAPDVYDAAKAHLEQIKFLANEADQRAVAYAANPGGQKLSIDPNKSGAGRTIGSGIGAGMPVVSLRLVWVVFAFIFFSMYVNGIFAAAALLALNWWSMGQPRKALATLVTSIAVWGLFAVPIQIVFEGSPVSSVWPFSIALVLQAMASTGVVFWQVREQRPVYLQSVEKYGKPSGWACGNIVLTVVVILAGCTMSNMWSRTFNPIEPTDSLRIASATTYQNKRIAFEYPKDWVPLDVADATCTQAEAQYEGRLTCWGVGAEKRLSVMMYIEIKDYFGFLSSLDGVSRNDIASIESNPETERESEDATQLKFKIDGRDAIKYQYPYTIKNSSSTLTMVGTVLYIRDRNDWIRLYIYTPPGRVSTADAIVESVHFVTPLEK